MASFRHVNYRTCLQFLFKMSQTCPVTLVLGLDIGSTTTKAALVDVTDGVSVVHMARRTTPALPADLLAAVAAVSRECAAAASAPISAVGIASMAESGAALDAEGRALTPLLRWDRRVDRRHLDALLADHPGLSLATGIPATTKPAAVTLAALRVEQPAVHSALRHWAGVADLVAHALTGIRATDHTLAARTMLAGRGDAWNADLIADLGISEHAFPALRAPGEAVGATSASAREFGLEAGIPVHIAGHDHAVGAWAAGVRLPGETADSLGTSEAIVRVTDAVDIARAVDEGFSVGRTVDGTATTIVGGSPSGGALLAWWEAEFPEDRVLERLAELAPDHWKTSSTIVLPYLSGRQCPAPQSTAGVQIFGTGDADERTRGVLQSLISHARWMRETADALAGSPTAALTLIGSIVRRVPVWAPLAAASGVPTTVCAADEPVAAGAALLAAVRSGHSSADISILPLDDVVAVGDPALEDAHRRFLATVTPRSIPSRGES
jgi:xylulokinase